MMNKQLTLLALILLTAPCWGMQQPIIETALQKAKEVCRLLTHSNSHNQPTFTEEEYKTLLETIKLIRALHKRLPKRLQREDAKIFFSPLQLEKGLALSLGYATCDNAYDDEIRLLGISLDGIITPWGKIKLPFLFLDKQEEYEHIIKPLGMTMLPLSTKPGASCIYGIASDTLPKVCFNDEPLDINEEEQKKLKNKFYKMLQATLNTNSEDSEQEQLRTSITCQML